MLCVCSSGPESLQTAGPPRHRDGEGIPQTKDQSRQGLCDKSTDNGAGMGYTIQKPVEL